MTDGNEAQQAFPLSTGWSFVWKKWHLKKRQQEERRKESGKVLTWRRRWSGTFVAGLWRWWRTVPGSCGWSSRSRVSRTPPVNTGTWSRPPAGWHTGRRSYTHRAHSGPTIHSPRSARLREERGIGCHYILFIFEIFLAPCLDTTCVLQLQCI